MAANSEGFVIEDGILKRVSNNYIKKNNGYFEIPDSVTTIGNIAFLNCSCLQQIIIPDSVTIIDGHVFQNCINLTSIIIPDSVITMGDYAFAYCSNLKSIFLSDSIAGIGSCALTGCHKDLEITITTLEPSEEKATALKEKLQARYSSIKIHIDNPLERLKGLPTFFSQPSEQEDGDPLSNKQNQPGA